MRDKDSSLVKLEIAQPSEPDFLRPQSRRREKRHEEPGHDSRPSFDSLRAPEQPLQVLIVEDSNRSRDGSREPDVPLPAEVRDRGIPAPLKEPIEDHEKLLLARRSHETAEP